jgi:hypothetical protein
VQIETGLLKNYLKVDGARAATWVEKSADQAPTLTEIHEVIVVQHALLTRGLAEFTEELGQSCRSALGDLDLLSEQGKIRIDKAPISSCGTYWLTLRLAQSTSRTTAIACSAAWICSFRYCTISCSPELETRLSEIARPWRA